METWLMFIAGFALRSAFAARNAQEAIIGIGITMLAAIFAAILILS